MAITIVLAMLVLLIALRMPNLMYNPETPVIFEITTIRHTNEHGVLNYDSRMILRNSGDTAYDNRKLSAKTYRNGAHLPCDIPTMNGHNFIPVHPYGIQTLGGFGSDDFLWYPGALIAIDYTDGTFHPDDRVEFDVYDTTNGQLISRDTYPHDEGIQERSMRLYLSHQGA